MADKVIVKFIDDSNVTFDRKNRKGFPKIRHEFSFVIITDEYGDEFHIPSNSIKNIRVHN